MYDFGRRGDARFDLFGTSLLQGPLGITLALPAFGLPWEDDASLSEPLDFLALKPVLPLFADEGSTDIPGDTTSTARLDFDTANTGTASTTDSDWYGVTLDADEVLAIEIEGEVIDGVTNTRVVSIGFHAADGTLIYEQTISSSNSRERTVDLQAAAAGEYFISVTGTDANDTTYSVVAARTDDDYADNLTTTGVVARPSRASASVGAKTTGSLSTPWRARP